VDRLQLAAPQEALWRQGKLPDALHKARAHPEWSSLNPGARLQQAEREEQIEHLGTTLIARGQATE
jgi:hypothetical protein